MHSQVLVILGAIALTGFMVSANFFEWSDQEEPYQRLSGDLSVNITQFSGFTEIGPDVEFLKSTRSSYRGQSSFVQGERVDGKN